MDYAKIFTCIMHAHLNNIAESGSYNNELNRLLQMNNLPKINTPPNPPSAKIINNLNKQKSNIVEEGEEEEVMEAAYSSQVQNEQEQPIIEGKLTNKERSRSRQRKNTENETIKDTDIGLTIYTSESNGWPRETLTRKKLMENIDNKLYVVKYESKDIDYFAILDLLNKGKIELTKCWKTIEDAQFRKLRPGKTLERTPPNRNEKYRKNST